MTLEQLKVDIRNAYEGRDREAMEQALAAIDHLVRPPVDLSAIAYQRPMPPTPFGRLVDA